MTLYLKVEIDVDMRRRMNVVFDEISTSILRRFYVTYTLDRRRNMTSKLR